MVHLLSLGSELSGKFRKLLLSPQQSKIWVCRGARWVSRFWIMCRGSVGGGRMLTLSCVRSSCRLLEHQFQRRVCRPSLRRGSPVLGTLAAKSPLSWCAPGPGAPGEPGCAPSCRNQTRPGSDPASKTSPEQAGCCEQPAAGLETEQGCSKVPGTDPSAHWRSHQDGSLQPLEVPNQRAAAPATPHCWDSLLLLVLQGISSSLSTPMMPFACFPEWLWTFCVMIISR